MLADWFGEHRILDVDGEFAKRAEDFLVEDVEVTPRSARKLVRHLLGLRTAVAARLDAPALPDVELGPLRPAPEPEVSLDEYAVVRSWFREELRPGIDLIVGCRLRPAKVLQLRSDAVGPGGCTIRVRGRREEHLLPVPAFAREDLALLACRVGPGAPLFPGRSKGSTLNPATLRRRVKEVSREHLGREVNLQDLGHLAELVLGPASGNPAGRLAAVRRIAVDWEEVEWPPGWEAAEDIVEEDHGGLQEVVSDLLDRVAELEKALEDTREKVWEAADVADHVEFEMNYTKRDLREVRAEVRRHSGDGRIHPVGPRVSAARIEEGFKKLAARQTVQERRLDRLNTDTAPRRAIQELHEELKETNKKLDRVSTASTSAAFVLLALVWARISDLELREKLEWMVDNGVISLVTGQHPDLGERARRTPGEAGRVLRVAFRASRLASTGS